MGHPYCAGRRHRDRRRNRRATTGVDALPQQLPDDQLFHICTLAYLSDMTLLGASKVPHPGVDTQTASLDHAMWFLRPFRADEWLLYDQTSPSAGFGRALTQGRIFDRNGTMVAAVVQEGLTRIQRDQDSATSRQETWHDPSPRSEYSPCRVTSVNTSPH